MAESRVSRAFWTQFEALPADVQARAREAYRLWIRNERHPSLHFKRVSPSQPIWSARVGAGHRALALCEPGATVWWFWIGTHAEYDLLIRRFR